MRVRLELRYFLDARQVYGPAYPNCNGLVAGRGYTYPGKLDGFPGQDAGYLDPASLIGG